MELNEIQKAELNSAASSGEFFKVIMQYRKRTCMLVLRRWKGDFYRDIVLWEITDKSIFNLQKSVAEEYLKTKGKKVINE